MSWFFDDAEAVQRLCITRDEWAGTPFAPWSRAKGPSGGVDCVGYVEELMAGAGLPRLDFPRSAHDYSRNVHNDKILNYLRGLHEDEQSARLKAIFAEFPVMENDFTEPPMVGDLLILKDQGRHGRTGNGVFHMPVMIGPRKFTHCAPRLGVNEGNIEDPTYRNHLVAHFRARSSFILLPS